MKIQSRYKDFYDYISHKYGSDPDCVYVREPLKITKIKWPPNGYFRDTLDRYKQKELTNDWNMQWVVVGPHVVTFLVHNSQPDKLIWLDNKYEYLLQSSKHRWNKYGGPILPDLPTGKVLESLIKSVGAPVFQIIKASDKTITLAERIPILKDIGFPAYYSPQAIWQDIYATLTNVLRSNPDKTLPVQLSNKDKISKAGFDLKVSFRNPINIKKL